MHDRHQILKAVKHELGAAGRDLNFNAYADNRSLFRYVMHTLPSEISESIGTSTLFAAWNAAIYVAQVEDDRLGGAVADGRYIDATREVLRERGGLWFFDEVLRDLAPARVTFICCFLPRSRGRNCAKAQRKGQVMHAEQARPLHRPSARLTLCVGALSAKYGGQGRLRSLPRFAEADQDDRPARSRSGAVRPRRTHRRLHGGIFDRGDAAVGRRYCGACRAQARHARSISARYRTGRLKNCVAAAIQVARRRPRAGAACSGAQFRQRTGRSMISWRGSTAKPACDNVLVIAGDRSEYGPFRRALDAIDNGVLRRRGIRGIGIAGYPQGHPRIGDDELYRALREKIAAAEATGLAVEIVTQFCFDARAILDYVARLRGFGFDHRVRVGLVGPTSLDVADALCQPLRRARVGARRWRAAPA